MELNLAKRSMWIYFSRVTSSMLWEHQRDEVLQAWSSVIILQADQRHTVSLTGTVLPVLLAGVHIPAKYGKASEWPATWVMPELQ